MDAKQLVLMKVTPAYQDKRKCVVKGNSKYFIFMPNSCFYFIYNFAVIVEIRLTLPFFPFKIICCEYSILHDFSFTIIKML